ncbi:agmatine deiminase family protein [Methylococcus capsulatus]|uniref:agmatine deiminase family protein n=1 Tax=Methylococcus capsulatus TaxID=414 RepID=UPI001C52F2DC|nr:agmatine deiminase family protein [Methylococcus capsulatus]QXP87493.1 agmatine deiminase family protein [Methylococcus capsulatus]QXP92767.1 agmatine deiminase family protein [Methylococcus capsulatus]UQN12504.1 agmatine deiminase family protein [Methylococcus capsulatus]
MTFTSIRRHGPPIHTLPNQVSPIRFIPEWEKQSAVLIAWPPGHGDFAPWLDQVEQTYAAIATALSQRETLLIACLDAAHERRIGDILANTGADKNRIVFIRIPYDDIWVRDTAPLSRLHEGRPELLDFRFNGWGGKYECSDDAALAARLVATGIFGRTPRVQVDFVLEGGSVETDGLGTVLTTSRCLLNPNRNPGYNRAEIEDCLARTLGADRILWLDHGQAEGDDTDAHVDTLARFCSEHTIAYTACDDTSDPHHAPLKAMEGQLQDLKQRDGRPYTLVPLPIPKPIHNEQGQRLPATYANFLIVNDAVLVPVYADPADSVAIERLAPCFPDREIVPIHCTPLIRQYGSLHCMSMQFPEAVGVSRP